jgi:hypothetical protein
LNKEGNQVVEVSTSMVNEGKSSIKVKLVSGEVRLITINIEKKAVKASN